MFEVEERHPEHRGVQSSLWDWFSLSYTRYLTIPRSVLHAMPIEWQERLADLMFELDETIDWRPKEERYYVSLWVNEEAMKEAAEFEMMDDETEVPEPELIDVGRFDRFNDYRHPGTFPFFKKGTDEE